EYFEKLRSEPLRWGKPFAALLGALDAQLGLEHAAIGGKDSMSGSFLDLDVPPTLISFAVSPASDGEIRSTEWKAPGHPVYLFAPKSEEYADVKALWQDFYRLSGAGTVLSAWAVGSGGIAEGLLKMSFGNALGFIAADDLDPDALFTPRYGALIAECDSEVPSGLLLGFTASEGTGFTIAGERIVGDLVSLWEAPLSEIYPTKPPETDLSQPPVSPLSWDRRSPLVCKHKVARPHVTIPVFPGTNCEYDTANALLKAGLDPEILVVRNLTPDLLRQSVEALSAAISRSQIVVLPGGFSGGDEPEGSAKFICALLRNPRLTQSIQDLLTHRDGLMLGICNGFQALIKLGLVPYGEIRPIDETCPTLTHNLIGRHQSRYVTTRVSSVQSPWMLRCQVGDLHTVPISHGEGRFVCQPEELQRLIAAGQIATQYVDLSGAPSMDITVNPNGSACCVEGLFSPDGRVFGKMAHSERRGDFVAKNIPGNLFQPIFEGGAAYYA
ncbi:MAG: phosphoribosylformylglycinamidine synthase subunit PurQ, partial [Oscillospiraceae bacterium]